MSSTAAPNSSRVDWIHADHLHLIATAAWMAILLGLLVESAVLLTRAAAGIAPQSLVALAEFASSVTWAVIVCTGIALGTAAARHRERIMGLMGLLCAPFAWALAKGLQRGTQWILDAPRDNLGWAVVQVGALKTVEYTLLGFVLGRLTRSHEATLRQYLLAGLSIGVIFGAAIIGVNVWHAPQRQLALGRILGLAVNEIVFPAGCASVLHFIGRLNDQSAPATQHAASYQPTTEAQYDND
jgi:hypothetical protein